MASITKRTGDNGRPAYRVMVRLKGKKSNSKTFDDYETAFLWGKYQEMINGEMEDFEVQDKHLYTVMDIIEVKFKNDKRTLRDIKAHFGDILNLGVNKLTYNFLHDLSKTMLNKDVRRGGSAKTDTGKIGKPSINTIIRKFAYLSSAINNMISLGANLDNNCLKVIANLRRRNGKSMDKARNENVA